MRFTNASYETMYKIASELSMMDIESLEGFADDCCTVGAAKTGKYVKSCIKRELDPQLSVINMHLAQDVSGC